MMNTETSNTLTSVRIVLLPDEDGDTLGAECLWAKAVPGHPGLFALQNNSFYASLRLHDVVRTELDGCGRPQVVGVEHLHTGPVTLVQLPVGIDSAEVCAIGDSWRTLGSEYSEGSGEALVTAWVAGATPQSVCEVVAATAPGWRLLDIATAPIRASRIAREIDARLDRRTPADLEAEYHALCGEEGLDL